MFLPANDVGRLLPTGLDAQTQFADPTFVNRKRHDYRLHPASPARTLGFHEIETGEIG